MIAPIVTDHDGVHVVRDDLFAGGTKARFLPFLFDRAEEVVYASPAEGGAQTALATVAQQLGKRATIFVAKRAEPHPRALMAKRLGAKIMQVEPGYLTVVQARAAAYAKARGVLLAPFGVDIPQTLDCISSAALMTGLVPDEVWCASGSGVLARSLAKAWPSARLNVVQIGRDLTTADVAGGKIWKYPKPFSYAVPSATPFPSDPHYDAKAWEMCKARRGAGLVLFWNVTGPAA